MSLNNDVTQVMVLPTDTAAVTSGHISALAEGAWGVFNYETDTAFDPGTSAAFPEKYYFAYVGNGTLGIAGKLYKSAGNFVGKNSLVSYTKQAAVDATAQQLLLSALSVAANKEYAIRLEFRGNSELYTRFGYVQATKFFTADTNCAVAASVAGEVIAQFSEEMDRDPDCVKGVTYASGAVPAGRYIVLVAGGGSEDLTNIGGPATPAAGAEFTLTAGEPTAYDGIIIGKLSTTAFITYFMTDDTGATWDATAAEMRAETLEATCQMKIAISTLSSMYSFCNINPKYFKERQVSAVPSQSSEGISCTWSTFAQTAAMTYDQGLGYDINQLEYEAGGFNGKPGPYRQSNLNGLPIHKEGGAFEYLATPTTKYAVFAMQYAPEYVAGWLSHKQPKSTYFVTVEPGNGSSDGKLQDVLDNAAIAGGLVPATDI